jgi:thiamine biosynthesis lipoprotein
MKMTTTTEWRWRRHHFRAMNTSVYVTQFGAADDGHTCVEPLFRRQEACLSRFDAASELSRLNRCTQPECQVGPELYAALEVAFWAARSTAGIYDPTILGDLQRAGYDRSFELLVERSGFRWQTGHDPVALPGLHHRRIYDYRSVALLSEGRRVRRPAGLGIDLGGMGKGWTVDRAADLLHGEGAPFLVNAGGDLYAAGQPSDARGWAIDLEHPLQPELSMARLYISDRGLATSSTQKRQWSHHGQRHHHLIDPRTQAPAGTDALSVTVVAQRAVLAEILAKVALVLGSSAGLDYLEQMPGAEGLIYTADACILYTTGMASMLDLLAPAGRTLQPA